MLEEIKHRIMESSNLIYQCTSLTDRIEMAATACVNSLSIGGKILVCGNGGSAADAQHIAAEFVGRYKINRKPMAAVALSTDTSILTAVGNDYGFNHVFSRQIAALAKPYDVLMALSTSGNSPNIINAIIEAKKHSVYAIAFTGRTGGRINMPGVDVLLNVPSDETDRIQEAHHVLYHVICDLVEQRIAGKP